ncbi:efflux RND transporter periplasmic adaptor subunit [Rhizobium grahamii]|uniref:Efflux transporter periplasmic adaptor subunit n=1 Tax=Rhizobium grahamii TaxID=1120045 RepID=A0A370KGB5_9HYPH|nr:efflux transporter periplasmic adaptor subunit [Rhizobium grahamii]
MKRPYSIRAAALFIVPVVSIVVPDILMAQSGPTVGVIDVAVGDASPRHEFVGRVEAVNSLDVRSRIEGFLEKRLFNEGQLVKKDQELFQIDRRALEISLSEAKAGLASAEASLADAQRRVERNQSLSTQTVPRAVLEESQAARDSAAANVMSAEARVAQADLNLSFTRITSPIEGRIGASEVSVGSFVSGSSVPLARVVEIDPIRVVFSISDRAILDLRSAAGGISKDELATRFQPTLRMSNGQEYDARGRIEFFGNEIDEATGTLPIRTLFANPESLLTPGQFVTVVVSEMEQKRRPMVPLGAVQQDREGKFVFLVNEDSTVALRRIKVSEQVSGNWIVEDGLKGGEKLIVDGLQNVAEGEAVSVVQAKPVEIGQGSHPPLMPQSGSAQ